MKDAKDTILETAEEAPPNLEFSLSPECIGRYRIERQLGQGGFGLVFLGHDDKLNRPVAIKVPHAHLLATVGNAEAYLTEARTVANLDHPNIVPVYDVGSTGQFPCFIVSKYIDGTDLSKWIKLSRLLTDQSALWRQAAEMTATVAEALHYAHKRGLVHRDIKPGNILLDRLNKPFVTDFGLALREQDVGKGPRYAGTPPYMSPEQARGEGHRVDGRSDIFSLGIVLYELLTGRRPFQADASNNLYDQITSAEARPPRQIDDKIPKELDRICLKSLSKRAAERYTTAQDMADDLRLFLVQSLETEKQHIRSGGPTTLSAHASTPGRTVSEVSSPTFSQQPLKIIPKGLRSFDSQDADFFIELLPGPRDREGLPDSIRFWKMRIDEKDSDNTFAVGLVYGPSGCGKSSLFKAGLLPRLSEDVIPVYVEATGDETEARLLNGLRKKCPMLPVQLSLKETLATIRRGLGLASGKKVLIVLDQFEQWLHAKKGESQTELAQALRHCDGGRLQCIVMVRDDFWLAVSRFMQDLEVDLVPGRNIALVDLFDLDHAKKVLTAFGRAFGKLPENSGEITKEQKEFLKQAIASLSQENKVICVRLALFAEMMKGRDWTPAALKEVGGTAGIGVTFLEDTFSSPAANPKHRLHQKAARAVLKSLLPQSGSDIKGNMRSYAELLQSSGYANRRRHFDDLMRILDSDVRLITPTDPEWIDQSDPTFSDSQIKQKYYQLTHDYLVHSLRDWLTRKQKETRQGRAELRLNERSNLWNGKEENRYLPSSIEWIRIRLYTHRRDWTTPQRKMMARADAYYSIRTLGSLIVIWLAGWIAWDYRDQLKANALHDGLLRAEVAEVPSILKEMEPYHHKLDPLLRKSIATETDPKKKLFASLALAKTDPNQVNFLYDRLLQADPQDFAVIRQVLEPYKTELTTPLWTEFADHERDSKRRFRAACALVEYARLDPRWGECAAFVVDGLVAENPFFLNYWKNALEPVRTLLLPALATSLVDAKGPRERSAIIEFYRWFSSGDPNAYQPLEANLAKEPAGLNSVEQAKRKATIAAALAALGKTEGVYPLLVHTPTPTLRSFLIERLGTSGVDPVVIKQRLELEKDTSIRRALILTLGTIPSDRSPELVPVLLHLYQNDPDPGVHAAAGWALRTWKQGAKLRSIDQKLATGQPEGNRRWYINKQLQTFSIIDGPGKLVGEDKDATLSIHRFAVAATEVTVQQFQAFRLEHQPEKRIASTPDSPVNKVSWHDAAAYCNWLSKEEGIPVDQWCYTIKDGKCEYVPDYQKRTGYRLPTGPEWGFACQGGSETECCFGEADEELASCYAWWELNARDNGVHKSFPVALLKPNDWGLFDMHGNLREWCQEPGTNPNALEKHRRVAGSFYSNDLRSLGSQVLNEFPEDNDPEMIGFRLVRSFIAEPSQHH